MSPRLTPGLPAAAQGPAQNRAVDGDEVAVHLLPPSQWHHMRGGSVPTGDLLPLPAADPPSGRGSMRAASQPGCASQSRRDLMLSGMGARLGTADRRPVEAPL